MVVKYMLDYLIRKWYVKYLGMCRVLLFMKFDKKIIGK
jgi:hypothetical protein